MASTTPNAPLLNLNGIQPTGNNQNSQLNQNNMTIGQFGAPQNAGSTSSGALPPPTTNSYSQQVKAPTANLQPQSNTISSGQVQNLTTASGGVGDLTKVAPGSVFTYGGLQYTKDNTGNIVPYNAPSSTSQPTGGVNTTAPAPQTAYNPQTASPYAQTQNAGAQSNYGQTAPPGYQYNQQGQLLPVGSQAYGGDPNRSPYTSQAPSYSGLVGALANTANQPSQAFLDAQAQAKQALADLTTSRTNEANALSLNAQNPIPLEFQQGRGQILQNQYLQQQNAYAQEYAGATAQEAAATGQQGAQQSGLGAAGALAAPQLAGITNIPFNPVSGQFGQISGVAASGGQGGLQGIGNIQGQIGIGQTTAQQNAILGSAKATGDALQNLITNAGINPYGFTPLNGLVQTAANYTSNPQYQEFAGQINDFVGKIAPILGGPSGATTDYKTQLAGQILNAWASGQSIKDVISYFLNQAQKNIQGYSTGGGVTPGQTSAPQGNTQGNNGNFFGSNWFQ